MTAADYAALLPSPKIPRLPAPAYSHRQDGIKVGLAVESMKHHSTDEGWQIFAGLEHAGYDLAGWRLTTKSAKALNEPSWFSETHRGYSNLTDVRDVIVMTNPSVVVVQDEREWDVQPHDFRDPNARFTNVESLRSRPDIFVGTILKDSQQKPEYHRNSAAKMGAHFWIIYYHPKIVTRLAPYVRPEHCIRVYHTINAAATPSMTPRRDDRRLDRDRAILSGALGPAYPIRTMLTQSIKMLPSVDSHPHPGYNRNGCHTPYYMQILARYKVAICTSSRYGYALRKIMEATACGCVVVTDLPTDDVLPEIDGNLVRIYGDDWQPRRLNFLLESLYAKYDTLRQRMYADKAKEYYDYRAAGRRLAADIEKLREDYSR